MHGEITFYKEANQKGITVGLLYSGPLSEVTNHHGRKLEKFIWKKSQVFPSLTEHGGGMVSSNASQNNIL